MNRFKKFFSDEIEFSARFFKDLGIEGVMEYLNFANVEYARIDRYNKSAALIIEGKKHYYSIEYNYDENRHGSKYSFHKIYCYRCSTFNTFLKEAHAITNIVNVEYHKGRNIFFILFD